jgi:hypothetical protein
MTLPILLASSALVVLLVVALVREVRLRRALQRLLSRLLALWRNPNVEDPSGTPTVVDHSFSDDHDRV